jgi:hypothetical protein
MNIQYTILRHNSVKNEGFTNQDTWMKRRHHPVKLRTGFEFET